MKIYSIAALVLGLASTAESFSIKFGFSVADFMVQAARKKTKVDIFDDVGLPTDTDNLPAGAKASYLAQLSPKANKDFLRTISAVQEFVGEKLLTTGDKKPITPNPPKRSENWRAIHAKLINEVLKAERNAPDPVEGYLYFGNGDYKTILPMLCQVNPFFASALTMSENKDFFELIAYSADKASDDDAKYLQTSRILTDPAHRINCRFNLDMSIAEITKFDESGKAEIVPEEEWNFYAAGVLYNLGYYSSCIHATIHILHYIMCGAIRECTNHSDALAAWADPYDDNVAIKHLEVAFSLYDAKIAGVTAGDPEIKLLTGSQGFGGTVEVKDRMRDLLCLWGSLKNADDFTKDFLHKDVYQGADIDDINEKLKNADILTEFNKHLALVEPFADELTDAMKESDGGAYKTANKDLKKFMKACGKGVSSIDSISSWVQLMCCTGLYHGSTLSYTRLMGMPEVAVWKNIRTEDWDESDVALTAIGFQTIQGMTESRHVFMSDGGEDFEWKSLDKMKPEVKTVLEKYDNLAKELKAKYEEEIEGRDDLREYGWILTDHCSDGYDGKQHTLTTYF